MKEKINDLKQVFTRERIKKYAKYITLLIIAIFLWMFVWVNKCYIEYSAEGTINKESLYKAIVVIATAVFTILVVVIKNNLSDKMNVLLSYALFFASPVICFFSFELFQQNIFGVKVLEIRHLYMFLNVVILAVMALTIYVVTNSTKIAVAGLHIVMCLFGLINYYVFSFRGVALVAADVFSVRTASSVMEGYKLFLNYNIFYMFIITLLIVTIACKLRSFRAIPSIKLRIPAVIGYFVILGGFINVFVLSDQLSNWNINIKLYRPHESYSKYGSTLATVRTMGYIIVDKPEGYSVQQVESIAERYQDDTRTGENPNIIVIMDEAFSDLKSIHDFATSEDYMPFIRSLNENTIKGSVYVSVFGGNTANSEFEFLTGNSMGLLPANSVPYQLFIKDKFPSIVYNLEKQNYAGDFGMHPFKPNGFNRATIYPLLGFKDFITIDAFNQNNKLRDKITDETNFDKIIEVYESTKAQSDNPFFLFNVTMQNHGGYKSTDPNFIQKIKIEDEAYYHEYTQNYLSLIKYTDEAVEKLVTYFENVKEPTIIIFFGDHQPGLPQEWYNTMLGKDEDSLTTEELMAKYQVPFFAWANYDIPEESMDKISMNYLSAYLFDRIGLKLTKYQQYLLDVHKQVPAMNSLGYWGADGVFYTYDNVESPYYELLNEYRCVQYNNIHDSKHRVDSMFYLN